ncbi:MAG TPA: acylneuraminate cytidylyltransferase [Actinopolymorphaceae bacterium]
MATIAIIPARGGSKGVPGKNLSEIGGVPLVVRAIRTCQSSESIDLVVVSTDDDAIAALSCAEGARVVDRPADLCSDDASSESALLHTLDVLRTVDGFCPEITVFVQCTSPFLDHRDVDAAITRIDSGEADSAFAAVATYEFLWRTDADGAARGINHDADHRPRRQDRAPDFRETGAFYVMRTDGFRAAGRRFFGTTVAAPVEARTAIDVDTYDDLAMARALASVDAAAAAPATAGSAIDVDAVVTDFDGVHTDDTATVGEDGTESVRVSRADGTGISLLRRAGVPVLILSSETNPVVLARARKLGVEVAHGVHDKATLLAIWIQRHGLDPARVAYVGNDINDLTAMAAVGWPVAVPGSHPAVLAAARVVLTHAGGAGAVREVADRVLAAATARAGTDDRADSARQPAVSRRSIAPRPFAPASAHGIPSTQPLPEGVSA